jgi:Domain of unknown function (DUF3883)
VAAWSREEVEATVADYLDMLRAELRGEPYNKTEHRRRLQRLLPARSDGAIERKHMNISAVLHELGFPSIDGYKPYRNYQGLLWDVTVDCLAASSDLVRLVSEEVERPAALPDVPDVLASLVDPPTRAPAPRSTREGPWKRQRTGSVPTVDYLEREARNRALGDAGEAFVIRFEQERLAHVGQERLASRIEHVAKTRGASEGFDVLSFETTGQERLIEVKTTRYGAETPFYISRNELAISEARATQYQLYRVFKFGESPRLFQLPGSVSGPCRLLPSQYIATVA